MLEQKKIDQLKDLNERYANLTQWALKEKGNSVSEVAKATYHEEYLKYSSKQEALNEILKIVL
jgi:hypothetical protein